MEEVEAGYSLSNLPDEILHRIFSFLGIRNIARLSVLSRRFQTLCTTAPSFFFSEPDLDPRVRNCACPHVFNFMNTLLQRRPPHALNINQLCFSSFCKIPQHRSLHDEWINKLFRSFHVDELYLYYQLPSIFGSLPRFQSLNVLKLNMRGFAWVKLPEMMKIASLETLHMRFIKTEDSVGEWVSESFPSLKTLFLCSITARASAKQLELAIGSSCLEDLTVQYCCNFKAVRIITENLRALSYKVDDEIVVEISAPNLQRVSWRGALPRLRYDARRTFKSLDVAVMTHLKFRNLNLLIQLFEAMRWAKLQHMDTYMLKDLHGKPSISFGNVRHLEICVERSFYYYNSYPKEEDNAHLGDVLMTFLKRISNLETLTFVSHEFEPLPHSKAAPSPPGEYIFKGAVRMCEKRSKWKEIKGVKKVKFRILRSLYYSMAVIIGMFKTRCMDLEEMTLSYPSPYHEFITLYLNSLESGSSALSINLVSF